MDWFHTIPRWHPRFRSVLRAPQAASLLPGVVLVEEAGALQLPFAEAAVLGGLVEGGLSPAAWCAAGGDPRHLPGLLLALESLARQGCVVPAGTEDAAWQLPDVQAGPVRIDGTAGSLTLLCRSPGPEAAKASGGFEPRGKDGAGADRSRWTEIAEAGGADVLLCDDYFDPRLEAAWDDACRSGGARWWLPVRVAGAQALVGPLLRPGGPGPCWHCFMHRLRRNHPGRSWLAREVPGSHGLVPLVYDASLWTGLQERAQAAARQLLADAVPGRFAAWDGAGQGGALRWSAAPRRPQCAHCGDPEWMARQARLPVRPGPVQALPGARGGSRTVSPDATVRALLPCVDGVAGVVTECTLLPLPQAGAVTVFRSAFHAADGAEGMPAAARWCLGKGMTPAQAQASALCEAVERYAAGWQGDEPCTVAPQGDLPAPAFGPQALVFISDRQRARAAAGTGPHDDRVRRFVPHALEQPLAWTPAWSLTREAPCFLPLAQCYLGAPEQWSRHGAWNSNGCAAGNCPEEAILQGLLEVVERDATAIWWYNELPMPAVAEAAVPAGHVQLVQRTLGPDWTFWLLDLTHDLGIPVVVAVGRHRDGDWALGFGCSLDVAMACERALTELVQLVAVGKTLPSHWNGLRDASPAFLWPNARNDGWARGGMRGMALDREGGGLGADIAHCVAAALRCGMEVVVHDYTRPDIPLHTIRTVLPGACHIWPELANPRLYRVPVQMGWRDVRRHENHLNPWPLYV